MTLRVTVAILSVVIAGYSHALDFKGVKLGASEKELKAADKKLSCGRGGEAMGDRNCLATSITAGDIRYGGELVKGIIGDFFDGKLAAVYVTFSHDSHTTIRNGLIAKFGKPTEDASLQYTNRMGAVFEGQKTTWKDGKEFLTIDEYCTDLDTSCVYLTTADYYSRMDAKSKAAARATAKGM